MARIPYERARQAATAHRFDYLTSYVEALAEVIDMDVLRGTTLAGASFLRRAGTVWTTDKDGLVMGLLAVEMTARTGREPRGVVCAPRIDGLIDARTSRSVLRAMLHERLGTAG